jgi:uncharacterized protein with NRDE domain
MCLLAVAFKSHPDAPLIVASNRDEFYQRPTLPMHWWADAPILAGRDTQAGGTWMGLSRNGRFAAVTNFRQVIDGVIAEAKPLSRGQLITDFLSSDQSADDWADSLAATTSDYDGFNLLLYDGFNLLYLNNHDQSRKLLPPGIYALSNHLLDSPWPKVDYAREQLKQAIAVNKIGAGQLPDLIATLSLEKTYAPELLPDTGVPAQWETLLSSPFIVADGYGTRASAAIIISHSGEVVAAEQCFEAGESLGYQEFSFNLSTF